MWVKAPEDVNHTDMLTPIKRTREKQNTYHPSAIVMHINLEFKYLSMF